MTRKLSKLQHLIVAHGSGADLARAIGVDRSTVTSWRSGRSTPSIETMRAVVRAADAVGMSREEAADCIGAERVVPDRIFVDEEIDLLVKGIEPKPRRRRAAA